MPSYVVTGASRGLGLQFVRHLSSDAHNVVIGLVRNKAEAEKNFSNAPNVSFFEADITDLTALKTAASETAKVTGGGLDYLINNAGFVSKVSGFRTFAHFETIPEAQTKDLLESFNINVIGVINTISAFLPLLRKGTAKKVLTLSTGMADINMINDLELAVAAPYSISKAAVNVVVAKYNALYKSEGFLFMAVSPGYVDTGNAPADNEIDKAGAQDMASKFAKYAPHFTGPMTPEESIEAIFKVLDHASIENGDGGSFVSHLGNKQWL
ncbi:hypothetical protein P7C71_g1782, partial [Lecanoromycetidae sp. Uapishka_2]